MFKIRIDVRNQIREFQIRIYVLNQDGCSIGTLNFTYTEKNTKLKQLENLGILSLENLEIIPGYVILKKSRNPGILA